MLCILSKHIVLNCLLFPIESYSYFLYCDCNGETNNDGDGDVNEGSAVDLDSVESSRGYNIID